MKKLLSNTKIQNANGFTILELLIVMLIIGVLASMGIYSSVRYSNSQKVENAARDFAGMLQSAKSRAFSQVVPTGCTGLLGYEVVITSSTQYYLRASCTSPSSVVVGRTIILPAGVSLSPTAATITFPILTGRVTSGAGAYILSNTGGVTKQVNLNSDARISL